MPRRDRRRFPRIRAEHPVRVRPLGRIEREEFGFTEVVGLGGCSVVVARGFDPGDLIEVQIPLEAGMVTADGRVAYERPGAGENGEREIGIEFLRISSVHRSRIRPLLEQPRLHGDAIGYDRVCDDAHTSFDPGGMSS